VNSAMKTGPILKLDDLINWCNSRVSARMRFSAITAGLTGVQFSGAGFAVEVVVSCTACDPA
jgi:hypothetical protein